MSLLATKIGLFLAFACLVAGTPLAFKELIDYRQIVTDEGKAAAIRIEPERKRKSRKRSPFSDRYRYIANYEFADEYGVTWQGHQDIDRDLYAVLTDSVPDTKVRISYARHDPSKNAIDLNAMRKSSAIPVIVVVVLWAFAVALYFASHRARREDARWVRRALDVDHSISAPPPVQLAPPKFGRWRRSPGRQI